MSIRNCGFVLNPLKPTNLASDGKTISGVGVKPLSTVIVYTNGTQTGTTTATASGTWSYVFASAPTPGSLITYDGVFTGIALAVPALPLGPASASFAAGANSGTLIIAISNLVSGETISSVVPNDGRVVANSGGTALVVGLTASTVGIKNYTVITNQGRSITMSISVTAAASSSLLPAESRIVFLGDSRSNYGGSNVPGSLDQTYANGVPGQILDMLGGSVYAPPGWDQGVVSSTVSALGDTATVKSLETRFPYAVAPLLPKILVIWGGVNDLKSTSETFTQMQTSMMNIIAMARALSSTPKIVLVNEPASSTVTGARETIRQQWNTWLATLVASDITLADITSINMADATISADQVHPILLGAYKIAQIVAPVVQALVSLLVYPTSDSTNVVTNSAFAGTVTSSTGVLPTGWSLFDNSGGATVSTALVTKNGRVYTEVSLTGTYTGASKLVNIYQYVNPLPASAVAGTLFESFAYVEVDAGSSPLDTVAFGCAIGGQKTTSMANSSDSPYPADATVRVRRSPPVDFETGTNFQTIFSIILPTASTATTINVKARFSTPVVRPVPAALLFTSVPIIAAVPTISGTVKVGQTLTASSGNWFAFATTYTYQWLRAGVAISGATANTYVPVAADVGSALTVAVTAANATGSSVSPAVSLVTAATVS